jgi:small subunit ribosomal protein S1
VRSVDKESEKISLGIKQMEPDPWETIEAKYPVGKIVSGKVRNLTAFGAFIELEEGIDGLVHISDMSWTRRVQHPSELFKKADSVEVKIIRIDHENRRISLGLKQLAEDPWPELEKKYAIGSEVLGTISKVLDRGAVVELDGEIEGFIPAAQLGSKEKPAESYDGGEQVAMQVIEFDRNQHKIILSIAAYYRKRERAESGDSAPAPQHTQAPRPRPRPRRERDEDREEMRRHMSPADTGSTAMADAMPAELLAMMGKGVSSEEAPEEKAADEAAANEATEEAPKADSDDKEATE